MATKNGAEIIKIGNEQDLKAILAKQYMKTIENFFGDQRLALEFLSNVVASVQRVPKLLECSPESLLNSFIMMASLKLMPSGVSGEAYVLPYKGEAQFQIGYKGWVTLLYRSGLVRSIVAEIVYANDHFEYLNGEVRHAPDIFSNKRGAAIGAYVILELSTGGKISKVMSKDEIMAIGKKFSKSYSSDFSPWDEANDPQLWMWRKTVLKQAVKLAPTNPELKEAIVADNKDSVLSDPDAPSEPKVIDYSEHEKLLRMAKSMDGLNFTWSEMPGDAKVALKPIYEEMKSMITSEEPVIN